MELKKITENEKREKVITMTNGKLRYKPGVIIHTVGNCQYEVMENGSWKRRKDLEGK